MPIVTYSILLSALLPALLRTLLSIIFRALVHILLHALLSILPHDHALPIAPSSPHDQAPAAVASMYANPIEFAVGNLGSASHSKTPEPSLIKISSIPSLALTLT